MKPSQLAKQLLSQDLAYGIFEQCEYMVMGITSGVSVPLPLSITDADIIMDVVVSKIRETTPLNLQLETTLQHRAAGLFKQWLMKKGRINV